MPSDAHPSVVSSTFGLFSLLFTTLPDNSVKKPRFKSWSMKPGHTSVPAKKMSLICKKYSVALLLTLHSSPHAIENERNHY